MQRPSPLLIIAALCGLGLLAVEWLSVSSDLRWPLVQAGLAVLVIGTFMAIRQARSRQTLEFFDIGTLFIAIAFLYTFIPLANFVRLDGVYSQEGDTRMYSLQPSPELVERVGWHYLLFMATFAAGYLISQNRLGEPNNTRTSPPRGDFLFWMLGIYASCQSALMVLRIRYGLTAETYLESYRVFRDVPVFLQQSFAWLTGFSRIVEIGILAYFFSRYERYRVVVWAWLAVIATATFMRLHARTDLMIAVGSSVFLYHLFVRRVSLVRLAVIGLVALVSFQALGVLRALGGYVDDLGTRELVSSGSEFESVFGNAIHILSVLDSGQSLPPRITWYLSEIAILFPQQLLPFDKVDPSIWYVRTFFPRYEALGGGYAWGAIAQSVVGFGLAEAALRGCLLAIALAAVNRFLRKRWDRFEFVVVYAWLMGTVYLSMRNVTFFFVHGTAYFVAPWLIACYMIQRSAPRPESDVQDATVPEGIEPADTRFI